MVSQDMIEALNDCIDRIQRGQSIEECLRLYPPYAAALRPMLEAGVLVERAAFPSGETQAALERGRERIRDAARTSRVRRPSLMQPLALAASLLLAFAIGLLAAGVSAQGSLPGDALYGLKRLGESVQLALSANDVSLGEVFAARRIDEIRQLLLARRAESVTFSGEIEAQLQTTWLIDGLSITVMPTVPGAADAQVGDRVEVRAFTTGENQLIALEMTLLDDRNQPLPSATASPVPTRSETLTATPSATATPTASVTPSTTASPSPPPSPTSTVSATPTHTLRPPTMTASPTSIPVAPTTPPSAGVSGGGNNENTNENDNESGDDNGNSGSGSGNSGSGGDDNGNDNSDSDDD